MGIKVLLADDNTTVHKLVEMAFEETDFELLAVTDGDEAIERLDAFQPDIVLADAIMPNMSGYKLCKHIKSQPQTAHTPVILLTGRFQPVAEDEAADAGIDARIVKPFVPSDLVSMIQNMTSKAQEIEEDDTFGAHRHRAPMEPGFDDGDMTLENIEPPDDELDVKEELFQSVADDTFGEKDTYEVDDKNATVRIDPSQIQSFMKDAQKETGEIEDMPTMDEFEEESPDEDAGVEELHTGDLDEIETLPNSMEEEGALAPEIEDDTGDDFQVESLDELDLDADAEFEDDMALMDGGGPEISEDVLDEELEDIDVGDDHLVHGDPAPAEVELEEMELGEEDLALGDQEVLTEETPVAHEVAAEISEDDFDAELDDIPEVEIDTSDLEELGQDDFDAAAQEVETDDDTMNGSGSSQDEDDFAWQETVRMEPPSFAMDEAAPEEPEPEAAGFQDDADDFEADATDFDAEPEEFDVDEEDFDVPPEELDEAVHDFEAEPALELAELGTEAEPPTDPTEPTEPYSYEEDAVPAEAESREVEDSGRDFTLDLDEEVAAEVMDTAPESLEQDWTEAEEAETDILPADDSFEAPEALEEIEEHDEEDVFQPDAPTFEDDALDAAADASLELDMADDGIALTQDEEDVEVDDFEVDEADDLDDLDVDVEDSEDMDGLEVEVDESEALEGIEVDESEALEGIEVDVDDVADDMDNLDLDTGEEEISMVEEEPLELDTQDEPPLELEADAPDEMEPLDLAAEEDPIRDDLTAVVAEDEPIQMDEEENPFDEGFDPGETAGGTEVSDLASLAVEPVAETVADAAYGSDEGDWDENPLARSAPEPEPEPELESELEPEPQPAPVAVEAPAAAAVPAGPVALTAEQIDAIGKSVAEHLMKSLGDGAVLDVVWQVVPELAEAMIKKRIFELEREAEDQ